jgi:acyl-CoA dehydrogenase
VDLGTSIVAETAARIFADLGDPQTANRAKHDSWKEPLWKALTNSGLSLAWVDEEHGGAGGSLADGFEALSVAGRYAVAVPLAETMLAGWLLARAGLAAPEGAMALAPARPGERLTLANDGTLSGRARAVPFARDAAHLAVLALRGEEAVAALVARASCRIVEGRNLAGDPLDSVTFEAAPAIAASPVPLDPQALLLMGAAARSLMIAGALETVLETSVRYANERVAFERPIAKFQAVQHSLARLAGEAAAAMTAATSAADALANAATLDDDGIFLEVASAKIRTAEAATEGAAIAHQVLGAIGFTKEHVLHRYTLRMLSWRDDFGNESYWAVELGRRIAAEGADAFWPLVASR